MDATLICLSDVNQDLKQATEEGQGPRLEWCKSSQAMTECCMVVVAAFNPDMALDEEKAEAAREKVKGCLANRQCLPDVWTEFCKSFLKNGFMKAPLEEHACTAPA